MIKSNSARNRILIHPIENIGNNNRHDEILKIDETEYHALTVSEIQILKDQNNMCADWSQVRVKKGFSASAVRNCSFYGQVFIGKTDPMALEMRDLVLPVGLYNSNIIDSVIGDNVAIHAVEYLSHQVIGNEVILFHIGEIETSPNCKFGNGIITQNETEAQRLRLEICNENGGRSVLPFDGMLAGDAWLWSRWRADTLFQQRLIALTDEAFKTAPGMFGLIGDRTVIKNCGIIKDVKIGMNAYIKGAHKLKNLTINSDAVRRTQIGEGCELVNGIIGYGCRIFYGVKAVRFVMASHSQLKYGARLINSYLGDNATISCCEVLNSLIFPSHEQHHNNSFLCASVVMGQSNIPAGATIGSNHNSRSADGEILARRGFWPGLCVNLKHNSRFASFTIIAKGSYAYELNLPIPFSLLSHNESTDEIEIMVGYWFLYNMYALTRNAWKYQARDARIEKKQHLEFNFLAPDTVQEMLAAMQLIETAVGKAATTETLTESSYRELGKQLLLHQSEKVDALKILLSGVENSRRHVVLTKVLKGYHAFLEMVCFFAFEQFVVDEEMVPNGNAADALSEWMNVGGQMIATKEINRLRSNVKNGEIASWDAVHLFYLDQGKKYGTQKKQYAADVLQYLVDNNYIADIPDRKAMRQQWLQTKSHIFNEIYKTREKDYTSPFRKMMYDSDEEMDAVIGKLEDNGFIRQEREALNRWKKQFEDVK